MTGKGERVSRVPITQRDGIVSRANLAHAVKDDGIQHHTKQLIRGKQVAMASEQKEPAN